MHLEDRLHLQAIGGQGRGRATGGDQGKPKLGQAPGHGHQGRFVAVVGGEEHHAAGGQGLTGGQFRLGVGHAEAGGAAHHLAGGAHLRPKQRIGAGKALEGQHRLFNRLQGRHRLTGDPQLGQGAAGHQLAGDLGQGHAGGLGHKRHGARRPRIGLNDEHLALAHGELEIDQAVHLQGQGQVLAPAPDRGQGFGIEGHGR